MVERDRIIRTINLAHRELQALGHRTSATGGRRSQSAWRGGRLVWHGGGFGDCSRLLRLVTASTR